MMISFLGQIFGLMRLIIFQEKKSFWITDINEASLFSLTKINFIFLKRQHDRLSFLFKFTSMFILDTF